MHSKMHTNLDAGCPAINKQLSLITYKLTLRSIYVALKRWYVNRPLLIKKYNELQE
jgi:hypothetical protein